jgi:hypothetical protein
MFKLKLFILTIFFTSVAHHWVADVSLPKTVEKRFNRSIQKLFKGEDFSKKAIKISDSLLHKSSSYFYELENSTKTKKYLVSITIANGCKIGGCDINAKNSEEYEVFYLYTLYNFSGELLEAKILDYQSDYGYEVTSKWWLKQFVKHQDETYKYSKNIDAISGATTSVNSTIKEMNLNKEIVNDVLKQY